MTRDLNEAYQKIDALHTRLDAAPSSLTASTRIRGTQAELFLDLDVDGEECAIGALHLAVEDLPIMIAILQLGSAMLRIKFVGDY